MYDDMDFSSLLMYYSMLFYFGLWQLAYARCYPWIEDVQELEANKEAFSASIISWRRTCFLAAKHARFSYQRASHLSPWQANIYADIAVISDLITSLDKNYKQDINAWYVVCNLVIFNDVLDYCAPLNLVVLAGNWQRRCLWEPCYLKVIVMSSGWHWGVCLIIMH